jgi:1-acyl-sn-glycerol-3-phosphate acyltransferase
MTLRHLANAAYHTLRICVPTVIDSALGRVTTPVCDARLDSWSAALVRYAHITIDVSGLEALPRDEAFVVMSNHRSHYDIPVLFQALRPRRLRMVAKTELFRVPIWAGAMRAAGFVEVNRSNRIAAMRSLERAREAVRAGTSIWIAPEGTRGTGGELGAFKKGGFHLAVGAEARILPIAVLGTERVLPARGTHVTDGERVRVSIGAPIDPRDYPGAGLRELMDTVRQRIIAGIEAG